MKFILIAIQDDTTCNYLVVGELLATYILMIDYIYIHINTHM